MSLLNLDNIQTFATTVTSGFFYDIEIAQPDEPSDRPRLYVAPHPASVMDPMLVLAYAARKDVVSLGKHTIKEGITGHLIGDAMIPLRRQQEGGGDNSGSFDAVVEHWDNNGSVLIFTEGKSTDDSFIHRTKTGAARMLKMANSDVEVVFVGLTYENKGRYKSRVLLDFQEPITLDQTQSVEDITSNIDKRLRWTNSNWETHDKRSMGRSMALRGLVGSTVENPGFAENQVTLDEIETLARVIGRGGEYSRSKILPEVIGSQGEMKMVLCPPPSKDDGLPERIGDLVGGLATSIAYWLNKIPGKITQTLAHKHSMRAGHGPLKVLWGSITYPLWWGLLFVLLAMITSLGIAVVAAILFIPASFMTAEARARSQAYKRWRKIEEIIMKEKEKKNK